MSVEGKGDYRLHMRSDRQRLKTTPVEENKKTLNDNPMDATSLAN